MAENETDTTTVELAAELTVAWLSNPNTKADTTEVGNVLRQMHDALKGLSEPAGPEAAPQQEFTPAVSVRKSLASKDHIISLIDGKPYRSLKRHLTRHGLTPQDYRQRYGLKLDYPMVSESYSQVRRDMAKKIGLGRKPAAAASGAETAKPAAKPAASSGRPKNKPAAVASVAETAKPAAKPAAKRGRPKKTLEAPTAAS